MTETISAYSSQRDSTAAGRDIADQIARRFEKPDAFIVFVSSSYDYAALLKIFADRFPQTVLVGCSSAGEFNTAHQGERGVSAFAISSDEMSFSASLTHGISTEPEAAAKRLLNGFRGYNSGTYRFRSALILNDALAGSADELVHHLNIQTGGKYKFFGGGAGDDAAFTRTHVFMGGEIASDAAVGLEILSNKPLGIGVRHGWTPATDLMRVTAAEGVVVGSLDAAPAAEVFANYARETGQSLDVDAPIPFFLHNIVGLKSEEGYKLRVPLSIAQQRSVAFAAEVPTGSAVCIMSASPESSAAAAREATEDAVRQLTGNKPAGALLFDCVATRLRLGKAFGDELNAVKEALGSVALAGCNTYGQIASAEGQFTGFHNCTAVICVFPE